MASTRVRPRREVVGRGKVIRMAVPTKRNVQSGPILNRLTVVWVQNNGVTFNTTGFFARLFRGNTLVSTAFFDNFGVVRFGNIGTLTNATFTIQTFSPTGILFRQRTIPAGSEAFAIIG
ncbi:hypothetical protein [Paenibacillus spongiae]|uniref:Coat protein n=1 Tax=Paenibacillus spongiae TaxID=2909671 RepID=A0ABY5SCG8_9BACL|nr:hypothetical protein [Paenibacillus spongiae]UVI31656.1 hypothetical protein L1F29_07490 [Paenibacillus spongiae]